MSRVCLDSCIVIYALQTDAPLHTAVRTALRQALGLAETCCVSELTRLECRIWPIRERNPALLDQFDRFFAMPVLCWLPIERPVFELATELRTAHRLKTPDALHLAAALLQGCAEFWTNDQRLAPAAAGRLRLVMPDRLPD